MIVTMRAGVPMIMRVIMAVAGMRVRVVVSHLADVRITASKGK